MEDTGAACTSNVQRVRDKRLNAVVLRDVLIRKANLKDALAALNQLCVEASGRKGRGLEITFSDKLPQLKGDPVLLQGKEISAWEALKDILSQGAADPYLRMRSGRLIVHDARTPVATQPVVSTGEQLSDLLGQQGLPMRKPAKEGEGFIIMEYKVAPTMFRRSVTRLVEAVAPPKDFLSCQGVTFNQGAFAMYSPASNTLVVKNSPEMLLVVKKAVRDAYYKAKADALKAAKAPPVIIDGNAPDSNAPPEKGEVVE